jgi:hypothetical protein
MTINLDNDLNLNAARHSLDAGSYSTHNRIYPIASLDAAKKVCDDTYMKVVYTIYQLYHFLYHF